jgi:hypothetical protein
MNKHPHMQRWGAAYLLLGLFLGSWLGQWIAMGDADAEFWAATFENWQSEWLQLFVQAAVLLGMKHVIFKADAHDMEQVQLDLAEIKEHLGIAPRDEATRHELEDLHRVKAGERL